MTARALGRRAPRGGGPRGRAGRFRAAALSLGMLGVVMVVVTGCTGSGKPTWSNGPAVIAVAMREYRFDYDPAIPAGRVVFEFFNAGHVEHRPVLLALPEDLPPIDIQLRGTERRGIAPFAGVPAQAPGEAGTFAVDLLPGRRYALICFARGADGEPHFLEGMNSEFRAGNAAEQ